MAAFGRGPRGARCRRRAVGRRDGLARRARRRAARSQQQPRRGRSVMARGPRPGSTAGRTPRVAGQRRAPSAPGSTAPSYPLPPQAEPERSAPVSTSPPTTEQPTARTGWRERLVAVRSRLPHGRPAAGWGASDARRGVIAIALITLIVVFGTLTGLYLQGYLHARAVQN